MKRIIALLLMLGGAALTLGAEVEEVLPEAVEPRETAAQPEDAAAALRHDTTNLEGVVIQHGGRKKPLLTFAKESLLTISGRTRLSFDDGERIDAMGFIASMWLGGRNWMHHPVVSLDHAGVKEALALDMEARRHAYHDIVTAPRFTELLEELDARTDARGEDELSDFYDNFSQLVRRLQLVRALEHGSVFTVVPHPTDDNGRWVSFSEAERYYSEEELQPLMRTRGGLILAYNPGLLPEELYRELAGDLDFEVAALRFKDAQRAISPGVMPSETKIKTEVLYERWNPFRIAYLFSFLSCLAIAFTWTVWRRPGLVIGWGFAAAAILTLAIGMAARVYISGRAPVTNMYETVIWVAFGLLVFAAIFEFRYRCRYYLVSATPFAGLLLILAESAPVIFDPSISPLTPVLRDNFWLTTHVLTVTISYAAFALAFALGHFVLGNQIIKGGKVGTNPDLYAYIYRAMQVGILLLAIGVALGAVWANYSWGRFWDWDPKETWSLIALLGYLFVLHGRLVGWWSGFGFSVGAVLGFQGILMCWYGVNFILGAGLHSYGFGTGGTGYVIGFVVFEIMFVAAALLRRYVWHAESGGMGPPKVSPDVGSADGGEGSQAQVPEVSRV